MKIRLNNTKKGLTTVWSLEKFESAMEQMRDLYQVRTAYCLVQRHSLGSLHLETSRKGKGTENNVKLMTVKFALT